jgi:hypothetical protein
VNDPLDAVARYRHPAPFGLSPEAALSSALVDVVRRVLQDELTAHLEAVRSPPRSPWMTPPAAARASGVPVKSIRAWARTGRISRRLKNRSADPKQKKYLVNLNEVATTAEQLASASTSPPSSSVVQVEGVSFHERASEILAARAARER